MPRRRGQSHTLCATMIDGNGLPKSLIIERDDQIGDTLSQGGFLVNLTILFLFLRFLAIFCGFLANVSDFDDA